MKKIILVVFLSMVSCVALADTSASANPQSTAGSIGSITSNSGNVAGTDLSNAVPNVSAPNLATTLTETCMGSSSGGAAGAGFGFSFGTTWRDHACVRRLDSRQMAGLGDVSTAREMMCDSDLVRDAAKRVGRPCMEDGGVPFGVVVSAPVQTQVIPTPEAAAPVVQQIVHQ